MDPPTDRAKELFLDALDLPTPADRRAFLDRACGPDTPLRAEVEDLLAHHRKIGSFLASVAAGDPAATRDFADTPTAAAADAPGGVVGPYRLLEPLGEGGFGLVYAAEQTTPVRRRVALKVLKPGMDTREVVARFEAERQALALMDHPHIAAVFDAGATPAGRPYFVMELVRGVPITKYCDDRRLRVRDRLGLFADLCGAVQHAHQKGVIHRDLKPSNVLVAEADGRPVVKVIDFGVAKAVGQSLTDKTVYTRAAQLIGTPLYMSPEQAGGGPDVDTRADIYALGAVLYELLTGTTPFPADRLRGLGYDEVRRVIREEEPPRPSEVRSGERGARNRRRTFFTPRSALPAPHFRELDWVVMKALEKDRNRRYESAAALAADVRRFLADEPVLACPPSAGYRFRKFARRNTAALAAAAAAALVGLGLVAAVVWHNARLAAKVQEVEDQRAAKEREAARADANFAKTLEAVDQFLSRIGHERLAQVPGMERVRREVLEDALRFFQGFLAVRGDEPAVRRGAAGAYFRAAHIQSLLGRHADAEGSYRRAVELNDRLTAEFPDDPAHRRRQADTLTNLALLLHTTGRPAEAEPAHRRAVGLNEELTRQDPDDPARRTRLARGYSDLATLLRGVGRTEEAEAYFRRALDLQEGLAADPAAEAERRDDLARTHLHFGALLKSTGRAPGAEEAYRRAIDLWEKLMAGSPGGAGYRYELAGAYSNLGVLLDETGRPGPAEAGYRRALDLAAGLAADFPAVPSYRAFEANAHLNLAAALRTAGRVAEADAAAGRALGLFEKLVADNPAVPDYRRNLAASLSNLANMAAGAGQFPKAEGFMRRSAGLRRELAPDASAPPEDRAQLALALYNLAQVLDGSDRHREAEAALREVIGLLGPLAAEFPSNQTHRTFLGAALQNLSVHLRERGEVAGARPLLERAVEHQSAALAINPRHPHCRTFLANHYRSLADVLVEQEEHARAAETAAEAPRLFPEAWQEHVRAAGVQARCVALAEEDGRLTPDQRAAAAGAYAERAVASLREAAARGCPDLAGATKPTAFNPLRSRDDFKRLLSNRGATSVAPPPRRKP